MTNEQILKKAIEKAVKNGYCGVIAETELQFSDMIGTNQHLAIIFSHSFAKAFWGEKIIVECQQCDSKGYGEPPCKKKKKGKSSLLWGGSKCRFTRLASSSYYNGWKRRTPKVSKTIS